jgi:ribonuclease G
VTLEQPSSADTPEEDKPKKSRRGRRGRKGKEESAISTEAVAGEAAPVFEIDYDNSGFERISDDEETGDIFKDAFMQEAIVDRVRAVEFDMEGTAGAEVGSLMAEVGGDAGGFERIADEEDSTDETPKSRGKAKSSKTKAAAKPKADKKPSAKKSSTKKSAKSKKSAGENVLEDAEASVREPSDIAEMAVRRGGRGRKRGGKSKTTAHSTEIHETDDQISDDILELPEVESVEAETVKPASETKEENVPSFETNGDETAKETDSRPDREVGRRGRRGRGGRGRDRDRQNGDRGTMPAISDLLKEGQEILVQIAKEPIAKKGARITSHIALPGRYLVYMPTIEHLGVSRKIESSNERNRLRTMLQKIRQDKDIPAGGFIVRTAGIGISEEDLRNDAKFLVRTWADAKKKSENKKSPALVHQDLDLVQRLLRDQLSQDFSAIRVDSEEEYLRTIEFMESIAPKMVNRVKLYTRDEPILDAYNVQEEIDKALRPRVWLKSGGYLVINQTEALVAIDVNTGKFVGKGNARLEDTITRTNMEAVDEIARQIRLRDLGGIIVLDLIDMEDRRNRHKVAEALKEALSKDKSPTKVLSFNDFGLIIMTRKRVKQSLERTMCTPCENCDSSGWVKSPQTVCYEILAEARRLSKQLDDVRHTTLRVHPEVSKALRNSEREVLDEIEAYLGNVDIASDKSAHQGQFDFAFI